MNALTTTRLTKKYGRTAALDGCDLDIPAGRVAALVGPNGAGKTTLLHLAVGLLTPTEGEIHVLGEPADRGHGRVSFVAQDKPLYKSFTVAEMLTLGRKLNPRWDEGAAEKRLDGLGIPLGKKVGKLSGGQQAQVALTLALAKRPDLLLLDEPLANLDPLARDEVMRSLMGDVAETGLSVLLSSHVVSDLAGTCDWLVVLNHGHVYLNGDLEELLAEHWLLTGPAEAVDTIATETVVEESRAGRQATLLVRTESPEGLERWSSRRASLEEVVLAYLRRSSPLPAPALV